MQLQLKNYHKANEILYVLKSIEDSGEKDPIDKVGIQKLLYLSSSLAPIKNIILSVVKFVTYFRGPYSSDIQNTLDHLVPYGLVDITFFKKGKRKASFAHYKITSAGKAAVENLIKYKKEDEIFWWISCITKLAIIYSKEKGLETEEEYSGIDKIVRLVYQDPAFKEAKEKRDFKVYIDLSNTQNAPPSNATFVLINLAKDYMETNKGDFNFKNDRYKAEFLLIGFFEYLYSMYLTEKNDGAKRS